jgi:hypothetical protein
MTESDLRSVVDIAFRFSHCERSATATGRGKSRRDPCTADAEQISAGLAGDGEDSAVGLGASMP